MRARYVAAALVSAFTAGLLIWQSATTRSRVPPPVARAVATAPPAVQKPDAALVPASITSNGSGNLPDAEALLRQLEPLAVSDKPRALALALEADQRLPDSGVYAEARRALIVTLLVDTERLPEARAWARRFTLNYPDSRYLPLVQGASGVHPRPRPSELRDAH